MDRRRFLLTSLVGAIAAPLAAEAQQAASPPRIGVLTVEAPATLRESLGQLGYIDGRNIVLDIRNTEGRPERLEELARALTHLPVDVIVATYPAAVFSARRMTTTIPIVMVHTPDPVQLGLVTSLSRPGGNITGVTSLSVDLSIKQLQLLEEAVPRASRIAMLWNPDSPWHPLVVKGLNDDRRPAGVPLQFHKVRDPSGFDALFKGLVREQVGGLLVLADPMMVTHRRRLADLATRHHLPMMGGLRSYTQAGGLMSYWANETELYRRAATYVDRILKGARPADLPVEQPTKFELVINAKTAKAIGLTIPPSLLARADQVIE